MTRSSIAGRRVGALLAAAVLCSALPTSALGSHGHPNPTFAYISLTPAAGATADVVPLINSGEVFSGVTFQGIPDGIGIVPVGDGSQAIDLYVTHEESHVPFPISSLTPGGPTIMGSADFQDSTVTRLRVDHVTHPDPMVTEMEVVLPADAGFIRFCSAFMAGPEHGFANYTFFVNEESNDIIPLTSGATYGPDPFLAPNRQAGYSVWLNTAVDASGNATGADETFRHISRMGRHNHENTVVVPGGWSEIATLSGDDTFTAPSSQLYLHTGKDAGQVMSDKGQLWAFQVTATNAGPVDPYNASNGANDYLDISAAETFSGRFIHVPTDVARGLTAEAPQAALENWSNANNVFQFIRIEDIAYDPDNPRTVYFTDTGATVQPNPDTGRMMAGGTGQRGRVFKMVLSAKDPRIVDSLTILADGNDAASNFNRPDNLDVGHNSLMLQEDTSNARIWRYDLDSDTPVWTHIATVTHPTAPSAGESSGIVDASDWLDDGWWALDVQSHVPQFTDTTTTYFWPDGQDAGTDPDPYQKRREDGQLLLMYIPGS